jgi:hypothetical protein
MTKRREVHHDGPGRSGLENVDPAHAPGQAHIDLQDVSGKMPQGGPALYEKSVPAESKKSHRQHSRRGHG